MKEQTLTYLIEILQDFWKFNSKMDKLFGSDITMLDFGQTEHLMYWYLMGLENVYNLIAWVAGVDMDEDMDEFFDLLNLPTTKEVVQGLLELGNRNTNKT